MKRFSRYHLAKRRRCRRPPGPSATTLGEKGQNAQGLFHTPASEVIVRRRNSGLTASTAVYCPRTNSARPARMPAAGFPTASPGSSRRPGPPARPACAARPRSREDGRGKPGLAACVKRSKAGQEPAGHVLPNGQQRHAGQSLSSGFPLLVGHPSKHTGDQQDAIVAYRP